MTILKKIYIIVKKNIKKETNGNMVINQNIYSVTLELINNFLEYWSNINSKKFISLENEITKITNNKEKLINILNSYSNDEKLKNDILNQINILTNYLNNKNSDSVEYKYKQCKKLFNLINNKNIASKNTDKLLFSKYFCYVDFIISDTNNIKYSNYFVDLFNLNEQNYEENKIVSIFELKLINLSNYSNKFVNIKFKTKLKTNIESIYLYPELKFDYSIKHSGLLKIDYFKIIEEYRINSDCDETFEFTNKQLVFKIKKIIWKINCNFKISIKKNDEINWTSLSYEYDHNNNYYYTNIFYMKNDRLDSIYFNINKEKISNIYFLILFY